MVRISKIYYSIVVNFVYYMDKYIRQYQSYQNQLHD